MIKSKNKQVLFIESVTWERFTNMYQILPGPELQTLVSHIHRTLWLFSREPRPVLGKVWLESSPSTPKVIIVSSLSLAETGAGGARQ